MSETTSTQPPAPPSREQILAEVDQAMRKATSAVLRGEVGIAELGNRIRTVMESTRVGTFREMVEGSTQPSQSYAMGEAVRGSRRIPNRGESGPTVG